MITSTDKISVIGNGRLGSALAIALRRSYFTINAVIDLNCSNSKRLAKLVKAEIFSDKIFDLKQADILFIAVPDDNIASVVRELQQLFKQAQPSKFVYHTSGVTTSDIFDPLRELGVAAASFHPIQTFSGTREDWRKFQNIYIGLEGDLLALEKASMIIKALNSHEIIISKQYKSLYHLACSFASNYLISLVAVIVELFKRMNFSEQETLNIFYPLLSTTVANLKNNGIKDSLTGPISRGDWGTLKKHLQVLSAELPDYQLLYRLHGKILLDLITASDKLSVDKLYLIKKLLNGEGLENA